MSGEESIVVNRSHYAALLVDRDFLRRLQAAGVNNWEGYDYALDGEDDEDNE